VKIPDATITAIDAVLSAAGATPADYITAKSGSDSQAPAAGAVNTAGAQSFLGGVSRQFLWQEVCAGRLEAVKIGRRQIFEIAELNRYIADHRVSRRRARRTQP
jgi:hypothetical protein